MPTPVLSNQDFQSASRILNLPAPISLTEPARLTDLNAALEGLAWKDDVVAASTANVSLTAPGTTLDGITLVSGNRVLLTAQTAQAENGIYVWTTPTATLTRSIDAVTGTGLLGAIVSADPGGTINGGTSFRQTSTAITIGTTSIVWVTFGTATPQSTTTISGTIRTATATEVNAGAVTNAAVTPATLSTYTGYTRKTSITIGDGVATSFLVTHNLASLDVIVGVYLVSTGMQVIVDCVHTSTNTATITFTAAPATAAYRVVVLG